MFKKCLNHSRESGSLITCHTLICVRGLSDAQMLTMINAKLSKFKKYRTGRPSPVHLVAADLQVLE